MSSIFGEIDPETAPKKPVAAVTDDGTPKKRRRLALTICTTRKPGMSEEEFGDYLHKIHSQLSKGLLAKYGMIRWSTTHNSTETRKLLPTIYGPQFKNVIGYDCFSQAVFDDVERVASMTQDAYYKEYIRHDPSKFADPENTKASIGYIEDHIWDGKVVNEE